jgi:MoaA/NifB/PqqE/SkfB family radical SAM enzyme
MLFLKKRKKKVDLRLYPNLSFRQMKNYYEKETGINDKCINPWFSATIKPNGDVTPCLGYVAGNLDENSFMEIWNNQKFKNFRKILKEKRFFPGCIRCCAFFLNFKERK